MNDFLSRCMHLLVPFFFMRLTSLHPLHFIETIFPLVTLIFYFEAKPHQNVMFCSFPMHAHTRTAGQRPLQYTCMQMASVGVSSRGGPRSTVEMYSWSKMMARCPCTPPSTVETFGEKISASTGSGKEIAGLLKKTKLMMMMNMNDTKIVKSRVSGFRMPNWSQVRKGRAYV